MEKNAALPVRPCRNMRGMISQAVTEGPYVATHARGDVSLLGRSRSAVLVFNQDVHIVVSTQERLHVPRFSTTTLLVSIETKTIARLRFSRTPPSLSKPLHIFVGDDACASSLRQSRFTTGCQKTVFPCLDFRAASSAICRADSCEPTRPIATDSAPNFLTSEARSSSSGARSEVEFITTRCGVKHFSRVQEKNFQNFFAVTQPNL